ncbi:MAG: DUF2029 domain-containing protein [Anaerolinea sp.]|nr:DUF2029 domain-containing protein [Anaerolinea sp.]
MRVNNLPAPVKRVLLGVVMLLLAWLQTWAVQRYWTTTSPGANDFYPRWKGAALFWQEGIDPYSAEATAAIQTDIRGRLSRPDEDQLLFVYPFYVTFMLLPLAWLPLSYSWIQAIWLTMLVVVMITAVFLTLRLLNWQQPLWLLALTLLWAALFYHNARTIILGQFAAFVFLWLVAALLALRRGRDGWAGFWLALTTIKPQMTILVIPALLLWALGGRRWRFIVGFGLTMITLFGLSFLFLPSWLTSFLNQVFSYPDYTFTGSPLWVITGYYLPQLGQPVERLLSVLAVGFMLWEWRRLWRETAVSDQLLVTLGITIIVTNLILVRTATTNYIIMTIPLFLLLRELATRRRWGNVGVALFYGLSIAGMWVLFIATLQGNVEHPIIYLPWPFGLLLVLIWGQYKKWWTAA